MLEETDNNLNNIDNNIKSIIYEIRGRQVMLDNDLAVLNETSTGNINRAVKRNLSGFPN